MNTPEQPARYNHGGLAMRRPAIVFLVAIFSLLLSTELLTRPPDPPRMAVGTGAQRLVSLQATALPDTMIFAEYSFDDGLGGPDPQGWNTFDKTKQDPYFHVDDFIGAGAPYAPLEGAQSLWCGQETLPSCVACPGYGDLWLQYFQSVAFPSSGDVTVSFLISYDSEPDYDFTYVQYLSKSGVWQTLDSFDGIGAELASVVVPADSIIGSAALRFHFLSDGGWSDDDGIYDSNGAVVVDSITVADTTGVLDFQDFEAEPFGALTTVDGDWTASAYPGFGDYAALFDGTTVLQEDTLVVNNTHLWGFFNGSTDDYGCGGHPEQAAVPYTQNPGSVFPAEYIDNEIRSPFIDLHKDKNGTPINPELGSIVLEFDVYRDLPLANQVFFRYRVRFLVGGQPTAWNGNLFYHGQDNEKSWRRWREGYDYVPGATHIQIAIGCTDGCPIWCSFLGSGDCHSHAPLIDNVRLVRDFSPPLTVTNTYTIGPGSLRQAVNDANYSEERDTIRFDIPGPGPHVIYEVVSLRFINALSGPVVLDATTQPGYNGTPVIVLDGSQRTGLWGVQLFGDSSVVRGLEIRDFDGNAMTMDGTRYSLVEKNIIHHNGTGILLRNSASNNLIGGATPDLANVITDNASDGIIVFETGAVDNSFLCNSIARNGGLGIDLSNENGAAGVTPNDPQDPDTGPNGFQNFPTIRWASGELSAIGASLNSIPNSTFTVQFFSNAACNSSGNGEGERYLGSTQVTTDAVGNVDFMVVTQPFTEVEYLGATATDSSGSTSEFSPCFLASPASAVGDQPVTHAALYPAAPNPFNPFTVIRYDVPGAGADVKMVVYDVSGRRVATLVDGYQSGGRKRVTWNGRNDDGNRVATGLYFYRMTIPGFEMTKKMVLLQ